MMEMVKKMKDRIQLRIKKVRSCQKTVILGSMSILSLMVLGVKVLVSSKLVQWVTSWSTLSGVIFREGVVDELRLKVGIAVVLLDLRLLLQLGSLGLALRVSLTSFQNGSVLLRSASSRTSESRILSIERLLVVEASLLVRSSSLVSKMVQILVFSPEVLKVIATCSSRSSISKLSSLWVAGCLSS